MRNPRLAYKYAPMILAAAVAALLAAGCTTRIGEFSIVSTSTPQYANMSKGRIVQGVRGEDGRAWFLFIPLDKHPSIQEAADDCMDHGRGDYIERARFFHTWWSIILFSHDGYYVIGDVGNSKD